MHQGEWCKSTNFELATRIPMYVVVPESLQQQQQQYQHRHRHQHQHQHQQWVGSNISSAIRRGVREQAIVESIDLMPTLADLAGLSLPKQVCFVCALCVLCA